MSRLKQTLIIVAGVLVAGVMVLLGLWQASAYRHSGQQVAIDRTTMESVVLVDNIDADGTIADIYARQASVSGTYRPDLQLWIGTQQPLRLVTALELTDGRLLAVVRGTGSGGEFPAPPSGVQDITGIFLASDKDDDSASLGSPGLSTVRLPQIAQLWPGRVIGGYLTLSASDSEAQGLTGAEAPLPEVEGSAQNAGYALQWWVFAAGAIAASVWIALRGGKPSPPKPKPATLGGAPTERKRPSDTGAG